tara:strand:- start:291 stop:1847 length:1557 start_codon:yes stop_codon:yes gene_type:complete
MFKPQAILFSRKWPILAVLSLYLSCANVVIPSGGERDSNAPALLRAIPPNGSVNVASSKFILEFDEYFNTDKSQGSYIISPSQKNAPQIEIKNKKLIIQLLDSVKEGATYSFFFNNYILDINENNKIERLKYVFSTGANLDSNIITGSVLSYPQLSPVENIWVLAYRVNSKKGFKNHTADFIAKTNNKGEFELEHLPNDSFRVFALDDQNQNRLYDLPNEKYCYNKSLITFKDSIKRALNPFVISEEPEKTFLSIESINPHKSLIKADNATIDKIKTLNPKLNYVQIKDSLIVWHYTDTYMLADINDTLVLKNKNEAYQNSSSLEVLNKIISIGSHEAITLNFNKPLKTYENNLVLIKDSAKHNITSVKKIHNKIELKLPIIDNISGKSSVIIPRDCFTDIYGIKNIADTVSLNILDSNSYGSWQIKLNTNQLNLIAELYLDETLIERNKLNYGATKLSFKHLLPGSYRLQAFNDDDRNGIWSSANFNKDNPAEKIKLLKSLSIKAKWNYEDSIDISF